MHKWQQTGVQIIYRHGLIRIAYNARNLKSAMNCDYVKDYEFVVGPTASELLMKKACNSP